MEREEAKEILLTHQVTTWEHLNTLTLGEVRDYLYECVMDGTVHPDEVMLNWNP